MEGEGEMSTPADAPYKLLQRRTVQPRQRVPYGVTFDVGSNKEKAVHRGLVASMRRGAVLSAATMWRIPKVKYSIYRQDLANRRKRQRQEY